MNAAFRRVTAIFMAVPLCMVQVPALEANAQSLYSLEAAHTFVNDPYELPAFMGGQLHGVLAALDEAVFWTWVSNHS